MTKTIIILVVASLAIVLFSYCNASKKGQDTVASTCTPVLLDKDLYIKAVQRKPEDLISVKSASVEGDCLTLELSTKCGKNNVSDFQLAWNEAIMKSMPPQINLAIFFNNQEVDKESTDFTLKYDLKPIQSANPSGKVILRVQGWNERVTYEFENMKK